MDEDFFPLVGQISNLPRYTNKRIIDPQVKCYLDEQGYDMSALWALPTPNQAAAYKSLAKYAKPIPSMEKEDVEAMNKAWRWTYKHFYPYMGESRIIDFAEAKTHLDMSTSSGAPFNLLYPTKKELFEKDPLLDDWLQYDWDVNLLQDDWTMLFKNSLKEEVRLKTKIETNAIRTFLSCGVDGVLHGTRLFVDMNEKMYANHLVCSSAVGMSPYKGAWHELYLKLNQFSHGYALDEKEYDSSLREYMMWGCARFRWFMLAAEFRTEDNLRRLRNYYRNLIHSVVITPEGVMVMKKGGNPSGSVNTIGDNTLILHTLLAYAWIKLLPIDYATYTNFSTHLALALVGDDNTWTVSEEAHEYFNAESIIPLWSTLGVTTTTDSLKHRKAKELDFLSAHTVFLDGVAVPIYAYDKLLASLTYSPRKDITPAVTLERAAGLLCIGWIDQNFRKLVRGLIVWLIRKYDPVLKHELKWQMAKCQIQSDEFYYTLFTGRDYPLVAHGVSVTKEEGELVKFSKPYKIILMSLSPKGRKTASVTKKQTVGGRQRNRSAAGAPPRRRAPPRTQPQTQQQLQRARRRRNKKKMCSTQVTVRGHGGYFADAGSSVGSWAGRALGGMADSVFGFGDYSVKKNSLMTDKYMLATPNGPPRVVNGAKGEATIVTHREYVGDITTSIFAEGTTATVFDCSRYQLNPGNGTLFPWCSAIAEDFQEYEFEGAIVEILTEASEVSTNLSMGVYGMAVEYNPLADTPRSKIEMLELEYASVDKVSKNLLMPIECLRKNDGTTHLFIALDNDYQGTDARTYDLGALFVATVGQPAENAKIGELWITYQIAFFKPRLPANRISEAAHIQLAAMSTAFPLGVDPFITKGSNPAFSIDPLLASKIHLPSGRQKWLLTCYFAVAETGTPPTVIINYADATAVTQMFSTTAGNGSATVFAAKPSATPNFSTYAVVVQVTGEAPELGFLITYAVGTWFGDIYFTRLPDDLQ